MKNNIKIILFLIAVIFIVILGTNTSKAKKPGNKLKVELCKKKDGSLGYKESCDNNLGLYCLPGRGSGICY